MSATEHSTAIPQVLHTAKELQSQGHLAEAKQAYQAVLRQMPGQPEALTLLGSIAYQMGRDEDGDQLLEAALESYATIFAHGHGNDVLRAAYVNLLLARERIADAEREIAKPKLPINPIRSTREAFAERLAGSRAQGLPGILLNTLPKSASESIWNRLAEGLAMAQGHVSLGLFPDCCLMPHRVGILGEGGMIAKEHIPASPHNLKVLTDAGLKKVVLNLRDPRQAALSWAHFVRNDVSMRLMAPIWRKIVPPREILESDFSALLDWVIARYLPLAIRWIADWTRHAGSAETANVQVYPARFERFRGDPEGYLRGVLDFLEIEPDRFAMSAKAETIHLRRGAVEEWREVLTAGQRERAWAAIPPELAEFWGWQA